MAHFHDNALIGASGQGGYLINQSLRFNSADSAYLNRTPATTTSRTTWTWSAWIKRGILTTDDRMVFSAATSLHSSNPTITYLGFNTSNQFVHYSINNGSLTWNRTTSQVFRDVSGWYHIVCVLDTSNATAGNRVRVYVNGTEVTAWATDTTPSQNAEGFVNLNTATHKVGQEAIRNRYSFDGYLAEVNFIDGTALTPSSFGETDTITGAWIPKKYSGSFGTNGFYLNFSDNSGTTSTTLGKDSSGNGNNWTPNNFSVTAGAGNDVLSDTPTNNWCTLNSIQGGNVSTFSNGNLDTVCNNASTSGGTIAVSSGKWYAEFVCTAKTATNAIAGICTIDGFDADRQPNESLLGGFGTVYVMNGTYIQSGSAVSYGATWAVNDNIGIALDLDSTQNTVTFYKNGTSQGAINISNAAYVFALGNGQSSSTVTYTINFGQRAFVYTPPTGYKALNTANLPEPTIKKGSKYFDTKLYTGNGSTQTISGLGFSPDLVWLKSRSGAFNHALFDAVRTAGYQLNSNLTDAETLDTTKLSAFTSDGFTLGNAGGTNGSGSTFVAWAWDANGAGSSNTAGTITSTVSANATAGFSIVTYTGTNVSGATVGHGLGVAPKMIVIKNRSSIESWPVYHAANTSAPETDYLVLNTTAATADATTPWNDTLPSSTVFTLGNWNALNENGSNHVAYCFSEVAGYSKFGSYTGNGSSDGPFVFCGFRPRWVMVKRTDTSGYDWEIFDSARGTYNVIGPRLWANLASSETSATRIDFLSNGFKLRDGGGQVNGGTIVFAAFAELPAKYSNAR